MTFRISETSGGINSYDTSFKSPNQQLLGLKRIKVWQHFYLVSRLFEKKNLHHTRAKGVFIFFTTVDDTYTGKNKYSDDRGF